jgi:hypothetical protein
MKKIQVCSVAESSRSRLVSCTPFSYVSLRILKHDSGINNKFTMAGQNFTGTNSIQLSDLLSNVTNIIFNEYNPKFTHTITDAQTALDKIAADIFNSTQQIQDISTLFRVIQDSVFTRFDIEPPEGPNPSTLSDPNDEWIGIWMLLCLCLSISSSLPASLCYC